MALTDDSDFAVEIMINESKLTPETIQNISDEIVSALAEYRAKELASETEGSSTGAVQPLSDGSTASGFRFPIPIPLPSFGKGFSKGSGPGHNKGFTKIGL